jgi:hypothetical protein
MVFSPGTEWEKELLYPKSGSSLRGHVHSALLPTSCNCRADHLPGDNTAISCSYNSAVASDCFNCRI